MSPGRCGSAPGVSCHRRVRTQVAATTTVTPTAARAVRRTGTAPAASAPAVTSDVDHTTAAGTVPRSMVPSGTPACAARRGARVRAAGHELRGGGGAHRSAADEVDPRRGEALRQVGGATGEQQTRSWSPWQEPARAGSGVVAERCAQDGGRGGGECGGRERDGAGAGECTEPEHQRRRGHHHADQQARLRDQEQCDQGRRCDGGHVTRPRDHLSPAGGWPTARTGSVAVYTTAGGRFAHTVGESSTCPKKRWSSRCCRRPGGAQRVQL